MGLGEHWTRSSSSPLCVSVCLSNSQIFKNHSEKPLEFLNVYSVLSILVNMKINKALFIIKVFIVCDKKVNATCKIVMNYIYVIHKPVKILGLKWFITEFLEMTRFHWYLKDG